MPESPRPEESFWSEYIRFWSRRDVVRQSIFFYVCVGIIPPVVGALIHRGSWQTPQALLGLFAVEVFFFFASPMVVVANERLKRKQAGKKGH